MGTSFLPCPPPPLQATNRAATHAARTAGKRRLRPDETANMVALLKVVLVGGRRAPGPPRTPALPAAPCPGGPWDTVPLLPDVADLAVGPVPRSRRRPGRGSPRVMILHSCRGPRQDDWPSPPGS